MKFISPGLILSLLVGYGFLASSPTLFAQAVKAVSNREAALTDQGWPRKFVNGALSLSIYQPHVEQAPGNRNEARAAVSVAGGQSEQTTYGVLWFSARTEIDKIN